MQQHSKHAFRTRMYKDYHMIVNYAPDLSCIFLNIQKYKYPQIVYLDSQIKVNIRSEQGDLPDNMRQTIIYLRNLCTGRLKKLLIDRILDNVDLIALKLQIIAILCKNDPTFYSYFLKVIKKQFSVFGYANADNKLMAAWNIKALKYIAADNQQEDVFFFNLIEKDSTFFTTLPAIPETMELMLLSALNRQIEFNFNTYTRQQYNQNDEQITDSFISHSADDDLPLFHEESEYIDDNLLDMDETLLAIGVLQENEYYYTEQILIKKKSRAFDEFCKKSAEIYNVACYIIRQNWFRRGKPHLGEKKKRVWLSWMEVAAIMKNAKNIEYKMFGNIYTTKFTDEELKKFSRTYRLVNTQSVQRILKFTYDAFSSFFALERDHRLNPQKYLPNFKARLPKYKKKGAKYLFAWTNQQITIRETEDRRSAIIYSKQRKTKVIDTAPFGFIHFPRNMDIPPIKTRITQMYRDISEIRLVPKRYSYILEIVYKRYTEPLPSLDPANAVSIDIGVNNLLTITNNLGHRPLIIRGGIVKSVNQFYNKRIAHLKSARDLQNKPLLDLLKHETDHIKRQQLSAIVYGTTKQMERIITWRKNSINNYFHHASKYLIDYCIRHQIGTIAIGKNNWWKQQSMLGRRTNQNFVYIPFDNLLHMITYKATAVGISVVVGEESYTSKCSSLDFEPIGYHRSYSGSRKHRGLFISSAGLKINADVNGAFNIGRKLLPGLFNRQTLNIHSMLLTPEVINVLQQT